MKLCDGCPSAMAFWIGRPKQERTARRDRLVTRLFGADCESPSFSENTRAHGHATLAAEQRNLTLLVQCKRTSHSTRRIYAATLMVKRMSRCVRVGPPAPSKRPPSRVQSPRNSESPFRRERYRGALLREFYFCPGHISKASSSFPFRAARHQHARRQVGVHCSGRRRRVGAFSHRRGRDGRSA